ncbi:uncharacterized protein LOC135713266 [Ochlerotatus camptorhynchus]|uniref:uncharacterized protein LOC135713266 n=1 Tax=Ochlerotatus camptorhynchus TaxID=644619 RepID=UPI0031D0B91E
MTPVQLQCEPRWFHGPCWLKLDQQYWPKVLEIDENKFNMADLESKAIAAALPTVSPSEIFRLRSSLVDLVRLTVYIQRFKWNSSPVNQLCRKVGCITSHEYGDAIKALVKLSQQESFPQELADLFKSGQVQDSSRISPLNPQLAEGLLCVGGRLKNAAVSERWKHPYILDHRHPFARPVVAYYHQKHFHAGQQQSTLSVECIRSSALWAVFVCLVTKAVHLELSADLTTQAFLAALRRFTSRRGKPSLIMCDNAKNFVGSKRELDELARLFDSQQFKEAVLRHTAEDRIELRFIPARSPNFGGLWESAVKSFKILFKRTIGTRSLVYDQMQTVLAQTEAILNSRPLTPISNDPDDF